MDESDQASEKNDGRSRKEFHVRSKSPAPMRFMSSHTTGTSTSSSSAPQRASSEKRRSAMLSSGWHLSTAAVHGVGMVAKKVVNNRLAESLWHSKKGSPSAPVPSDTSYDHTPKPFLNVADEQAAKLPVSSKATHEREKTPLRGKTIDDRSENSKTLDGSHGRAVNQQRWPSPTGSNVSTTSSKVVDQPENSKPPEDSHSNTKVIDQSKNSRPPDDSHGRHVNDHKWQGTSVSNAYDQLENLKPPDSPHVTETSSNVIDPANDPKPLDGSHDRLVNQHQSPITTSANVINQSEIPKPPNSSHGKVVNQHRWPGITGSNVIDQLGSSKHPDVSHVRLVNQHRRPGTTGSNATHHSKSPDGSDAKRVNQHRWPSTTTGSNVSDQLENSKPSDDSHVRLVNQHRWRGTSIAASLSRAVRGVSLTPTKRAASHTHTTRGVSLTPITKRVDPPVADEEVNSSLASRESNISPAIKEIDASLTTRVANPYPSTREVDHSSTVRGTSPLPHARVVNSTQMDKSVSLQNDDHSPITSSSPRQSYNSNRNSITEVDHSPTKETSLTPMIGESTTPRGVSHSVTTRGVSPTPVVKGVSPSPSSREISPTYTARGVSPTPTKGPGHRTRGVSPTPTRHSTSRLFNASLFSIFSKMTNTKKEKIMENHKENAKYLELLQNIQVQWQYFNASAEARLDLQRVNAEKSLFDMWRAILELRDSIAAKKIDVDLLILQLKLYAILYRQMSYIDEWASIQKDHEYALTVTTNDLHVKSLRLPIIEGLKADIKDLKLVVSSSVQVMQATLSSIQSTLSKLDKTHFMASELANVAFHERALLDECEIFLASAAPLQVKECSLRSLLIQLNRSHESE